jgi:hypothetical protein
MELAKRKFCETEALCDWSLHAEENPGQASRFPVLKIACPQLNPERALFLPGIGKRLTASFSERLIPLSPKHSVGVAQPMPNSRGRCRADFDCRRLELNSADGPTTCR